MSVVKTDSYQSKDFYFKNFASKQDLEKKGQLAWDALPNDNYSKRYWMNSQMDPDFIGSGDKALVNSGNFLEYIKPQSMDKAMSMFDNLFATIDMGGAFNKHRLRITDDKRGAFDFGIASNGLYRAQEYFNKQLAEDSPIEFPQLPSGVVPFEFIRQKNVLNTIQFWYTSENTGKDYLMESQQEGTRALDLKIPDAKLVFKTTTKKAYIMFEKKGGKARMVDLYVGVGGLGRLTADGMLARSLPLLLAARYFEMAGIKTRINATRAYSGDTGMVMFTYPIKDYGEDLDFNWIGINTSDTRWFRWNLWKWTAVIIAKDFGRNSVGHGSTIYGGTELLETFNRYKNWYFHEMQMGNQPELQVHRNLMIAGGLESPNNSLISNTDAVKNEFYRILDVVDFQFNEPQKAAERIYRRMVEVDGLSVSSFKFYVNRILADALSYPQNGQYATEPERQDELEDEYDRDIDALTNYLRTIGK